MPGRDRTVSPSSLACLAAAATDLILLLALLLLVCIVSKSAIASEEPKEARSQQINQMDHPIIEKLDIMQPAAVSSSSFSPAENGPVEDVVQTQTSSSSTPNGDEPKKTEEEVDHPILSRHSGGEQQQNGKTEAPIERINERSMEASSDVEQIRSQSQSADDQTKSATAGDDHHDHNQQHPHTPKRNYASKECGSKVMYSNEEVENRGAILNDPERDDYMRNPCERAQNKFLIIELCETIQPTSLEIANFELFSSSPRSFRVWGSERYPTQEWTLIGEYEALDNREVQPFQAVEHASYAKFVKLELLSHYGKEHFCTLSTFRIYGTSMVDEYEAEAASASSPPTTSTQMPPLPIVPIETSPQAPILAELDLDQKDAAIRPPSSTPPNTDPAKKDTFFEDYENNTEAPPECSLSEPGGERDNKLNGSSANASTSAEASMADDEQRQKEQLANETFVAASPKAVAEPSSTEFIIVSPTAEEGRDDEKQRKEESGMSAKKQKEVAGKPSEERGNMLKTIVRFGTNIKEVMFGQAKAANNKNRGDEAGGRERLTHNELLHYCASCPPSAQSNNWFCYSFFPQPQQQVRRRPSRFSNRRPAMAFLNRISPTPSRASTAFCPITDGNDTFARSGDKKTTPVAQQQNGGTRQQHQQATANNAEKQQTQKAATTNGQQQQQQRPLVNGKVAEKENLRPIPGTTSTHKESVFMKLNKRLAALEQNMSWSSEHLLELTKRCAMNNGNNGARGDEANKQMQERFAREAERMAKQEAQRVEQDMKIQISELRREVLRLSQQLQSVQTTVQTTGSGSGGFFYRPLLAPAVYASDAHCKDQACLSTLPPLHSTSVPYGLPWSTVVVPHTPFDTTTRSDSFWTTSQVVYLVVLVQLATIVLLKLCRTLCDRFQHCSIASSKVGSSPGPIVPAA